MRDWPGCAQDDKSFKVGRLSPARISGSLQQELASFDRQKFMG
jgi:hypothetical protein